MKAEEKVLIPGSVRDLAASIPGRRPKSTTDAIAKLIILAQQEARAERDREWKAAWAECGHFQTMTACDRPCPLRALLEGK